MDLLFILKECVDNNFNGFLLILCPYIDKDECRTNNGGCDIVHGQCINTPGSYHCACNQGYQLQENSEFVCEGEYAKRVVMINHRKAN